MSGFVEVRDEETGKLLFTFDPQRDIIRVVDKHRKLDATVVLDDYRMKAVVPKSSPARPAAQDS